MSEEPTCRPRRGMPDSSAPDEAVDTAQASPSPAQFSPSPARYQAEQPARAAAPRRALLLPEDDDAGQSDTGHGSAGQNNAGRGNGAAAADDPDAAFRRPTGDAAGRRRGSRRPDRSRTPQGRPGTPATPAPVHRASARPAPEPVQQEEDDSRPAHRRAEPDSDQLVVDHSTTPRWWLWSLVAVLLVAVVVVAVSRLNHQAPIAGAPSPSTSPSAQPSVTPLPRDSLMSAEEASRIAPKATWREDSTESKVPNDSPQTVSCVVRDAGHPNPVATWQRSLSSNATTGTSAVNRVDSYPDEATAKTAFTAESASLEACNSVPALIVSASSVTGLADQAISLTVAFQGATTQYHTIVLARTGREILAVDAADNHSPIDAAPAASALGAAAERSCTSAGGTCPARVTTAAIVPPSPADPGWLITSDLPRLTPDQGEWQAATPAGLSSKGTQCEGVTLASVSGPTAREQRTYLLYKDPSAPQGFGVDTLRFTFSKDADAAAFAKKIGDNIARCSKTLTTAKVSSPKTFTGVGENGLAISGRTFLVTQDAGSGQHVIFQVAIGSVGRSATYLLANVTSSYKFSDDAWSQLAVRDAQRASQAR